MKTAFVLTVEDGKCKVVEFPLRQAYLTAIDNGWMVFDERASAETSAQWFGEGKHIPGLPYTYRETLKGGTDGRHQ